METKSLAISLHANFECELSAALLSNVKLVDIRSTAEAWFVFEDDTVNLEFSLTDRRARSLARVLGQFASMLARTSAISINLDLGIRHEPKKRQRT
jgi:hypothetical protein